MRALLENIDRGQRNARACEGNMWRKSIFVGDARNKHLSYCLLPVFLKQDIDSVLMERKNFRLYYNKHFSPAHQVKLCLTAFLFPETSVYWLLLNVNVMQYNVNVFIQKPFSLYPIMFICYRSCLYEKNHPTRMRRLT